MGIGFWILIWLFMVMAFTGAWTFIVKGCESLDGEQSKNDPHLRSGEHH